MSSILDIIAIYASILTGFVSDLFSRRLCPMVPLHESTGSMTAEKERRKRQEITQVELLDDDVWKLPIVLELVAKLVPQPAHYKIGMRYKQFLLLDGAYSEEVLADALGTKSFRSEVHRRSEQDAFSVTIPHNW
jgi:hypothetical protein